MSAKKKPSRYALDVARFEGFPVYELAVVVHRETEAQRAIEAQACKAQHGDIPPPTNALLAFSGPHDDHYCPVKHASPRRFASIGEA